RAGHVRRACEVNFIRSQQQEPTESSPLLAMGTSRNPRPLGRGGCQYQKTTPTTVEHGEVKGKVIYNFYYN
ncbi:hypothetical protein, partial [Gallibacterium anatis]|uniref:hypothetical protein n=1 Tax=Gallibacterium anatis TaxID=750 RepID=UPI000AAF99AE